MAFGLAPGSTLYRCRTRSVATDRESPSVCSRAPRTLGHRVGEGVAVQVGRGKEQSLDVATVISDSTPNRASDPFHAPRMAVIMMIIHARIAQVAGRRRRPVSSDSLRELTVSFCRSLRSRTQGATGFPEVPRTVPIKPSVVTRLASHGAKKRLLPESDRGDSRPRFFHFAELDAALSKADIEAAKCSSTVQFRPA